MSESTTILALTGPPASGKSTISSMLGAQDVPVISTGDAVRDRARDRHDDPDEDDIWATAQALRDDHGPAGPTVACYDWIEERIGEYPLICVSDLRDQGEVAYLENKFSADVLVIRVDTSSSAMRTRRYVERELGGDEDREAVSRERIAELRNELYERESREMPYPQHHVTILNDDDVRFSELADRLDGLVSVLS